MTLQAVKRSLALIKQEGRTFKAGSGNEKAANTIKLLKQRYK